MPIVTPSKTKARFNGRLGPLFTFFVVGDAVVPVIIGFFNIHALRYEKLIYLFCCCFRDLYVFNDFPAGLSNVFLVLIHHGALFTHFQQNGLAPAKFK